MKHNIIKIVVVFACMILCGKSNVSAQVYSDEICIYELPYSNYLVLKFEGNIAYVAPPGFHKISGNFLSLHGSDLRRGFKESDQYLEKLVVAKMTYDSELSTTTRSVYKITNQSGGCTAFIAVDKSMSTIKYWSKSRSSDYIIDGLNCCGHTNKYGEGVRVDPDIFKPQSVNYDFLDD